MTKISKIHGREVLDSRGNPTVEVEIHLDNGAQGQAIVPSGASTGEHEAFELRDRDSQRYLGKGVLKAVATVNGEIANEFKKFASGQQRELDSTLIDLDGTINKERLGANAILAVSLAYAKASALNEGKTLTDYFAALSGQSGVTLPVPMMNILNGGVHADNNLDLQEFMIMPVGFKNFASALRAGCEVFHHLKTVLKSKSMSTSIGDEGGFAPNLDSNWEAFEVIAEAIENAHYKLGEHFVFAIDAASSEFFQEGRYILENEDHREKTIQEMIVYYTAMRKKYPLFSIEDPLDQNDWEGWKMLTAEAGQSIQLVGDDLFVTNTKLLSKGISQGIANSVLIKMNQIGTISETIDCIVLAKKSGYTTVISHRSGETEDSSIADLAVGTEAGQIKTGSLCRTDRIAKYNQLLRIEERLGKQARYLGKDVFPFSTR